MNAGTESQFESFQFDPSQRAVRRVTRMQPPLSQTESKVLELLAKRLTEKQIAEQLGRSHNTVHVHIRNIYRKLGVTKRSMLFRLLEVSPDLLAQQDKLPQVA